MGSNTQLTALGEQQSTTFAKRIAIFGATGGTGIELTRLALAAGLNVRLLVRNPRRMPLVSDRLRYVLGNVFDRESVVKTILGTDAVFSCLGAHSLSNKHVCERGTKMILDVMRQHGVRRLIVESAHGVGDSYSRSTAMARLVYATALRGPFADKIEMERAVSESDTDWTIVRPVLLTNGPQTSAYRVAPDLHVALRAKISRADTAEFMLKCYTDKSWSCQLPSISY
jgi:putative NADH-flavin reductase